MTRRWYILTGEYPPAHGGVSDYTRPVAEGLVSRCETVTVCAPSIAGQVDSNEQRRGVNLRRLPGRFGWRGLTALLTFLKSQPAGGRLLVQYVPHAFGWKAMNVALCWWLARERRHLLWVMFHEVAYPLEADQPWRHLLLARVNRWMARQITENAERVFVSTTAWNPLLDEICGRKVRTEWAPIPSNFEGVGEGERAESMERGAESMEHEAGSWELGAEKGRRLPTKFCIGHFGTFGNHIAPLLEDILPVLLQRLPDVQVLLLGRGSQEFAKRLNASVPETRGRVFGIGEAEPEVVASYLRKCDLLLQPFPDGVSTRRTSAMCSLALGRPMVTNSGHLTESIWQESNAVRLVAAGADPAAWVEAAGDLMQNTGERERLGIAAKKLYQERFSLKHTLDLLMSPG